MKPKNTIDSVSFNDGYLYIVDINSSGDVDYTTKRLFYYGKRTVTQKRLDEAAQLQQRIDLCVHIPYTADNVIEDNKVIIGTNYYHILQVQHINTTNPPISVLTLMRWSMESDNNERV